MGVKVRQKHKGRGKPWCVFVAHDGRRTSMRIGDKKAAQKVAAMYEEKIVKGKLDLTPKKKMPKVGKYSTRWLENYIKGMRRASTYERCGEMLRNHILPVLADKPLEKITRGDVRDFIVFKTGEGYARSTVCLFRDIISGVFNYAIDEEVVQINPASGITKRLELNRTK